MAMLDGQKVSRICFDYGVTLMTESRFELRFETTFHVRLSGSDEETIEPGEIGPAARQVLALLHGVVASTEIEKTGRITVSFVDGSELTAEPSDEFEAWSIAGPKMVRVVCLPGGSVTEWSPTG
jgi:hypothetical protein